MDKVIAKETENRDKGIEDVGRGLATKERWEPTM